MDHHCLFVNNCVGSYNLKFFFLLLLYTVLGGTYNAMISYTWSQIKRPRGNDVLGFERGMVLANGVTIFVISLILLPFVSIHIYLAATNTTTLEALKGRTKQYDLGSHMRNLKHAFGSNPWLWLSPFHNHVSDQEFLLDML
jgi:palmitoyltransferase